MLFFRPALVLSIRQIIEFKRGYGELKRMTTKEILAASFKEIAEKKV